MRFLLILALTAASAAPALSQSTLHNNGAADGSNGYSNGPDGNGFTRTVLDDFEIFNTLWLIHTLSWTHVWATQAPGNGVDAVVCIREDSNGSPGRVIHMANVTQYSEQATGQTFFQRPEVRSTVEFDAIQLPAGRYWLEWAVIGAVVDNNFALTLAAVSLAECWINYPDLNGLESGTSQFGVARGLNFALLGLETLGQAYCAAANNSTGEAALLFAAGSLSLALADLNLRAAGLPPNQFGYLLNSQSQGQVMPANSLGYLCLAGQIGRHVGQVLNSGSSGTMIFTPNLLAIPTPNGFVAVIPGQTWYFQGWYRDGASSNFTLPLCLPFVN